jgi:sulfate/thiosulfate-binding protein
MSAFRSLLALVLLASCGSEPAADPEGAAAPAAVELTLGAYTTPREAYGKAILPAFQQHWKATHGQDVTFEESYQGSGAQARAIQEGFEADVAALSLEADIVTLEKAGLITHDWRSGLHGGIVSQSVVVLAVRPGNPKGIDDWSDLAQPGVEILTPNVRTSGGAMWNVLAIYGAALRGHVEGVPANDPAAAEAFLGKVLANVKVMDKGARESMTTFESGVGDVAITYENEVVVAKQAGKEMDYAVPKSTILIENPAVVVDEYVEKHGTAEVAKGFVEFLHSADAQKAFAQYGLRTVDPSAANPELPQVADLFTVRDLGGWSGVGTTVFAKEAAYDRALALAGGPK